MAHLPQGYDLTKNWLVPDENIDTTYRQDCKNSHVNVYCQHQCRFQPSRVGLGMTLFHEALTSICLVYLLKYRSEKRTKGVSGVLYFQYEYICSSEPENVALADRYSVRNELRRLSQSINDGLPDGAEVFISNIHKKRVTLCAIVDIGERDKGEKFVLEFMAGVGLDGRILEIKEITISQFLSQLSRAERNDYVDNDDELKKRLGLDGLGSNDHNFQETLIEPGLTKTYAKKQCREMLCDDSVSLELERIFAPNSPPTFVAHPVHYIITADDEGVRKSLRELLLGSLFMVGRLQSRRVSIISPATDNRPRRIYIGPRYNMSSMETVYEVQRGGTVVLQPLCALYDDEHADPTVDQTAQIAEIIRKHRRDVLTIIELRSSDRMLLNIFMKELKGIAVVRLGEGLVSPKDAAIYLKRKAKMDGITECSSLFSHISSREGGLLPSELNRIYTKWYDNYLRTKIYGQYSSVAAISKMECLKPKGDAYSELTDLVGLQEAKAVIRQAMDYHIAQKMYGDRNIKSVRPAMHMVFTGNPGTAKTTVARLTAQIMKDNNLLAVGGLVEAGRADIVDRYLGGTAPKVRDLFARAKGSVLFIDEAYSLVDHRPGMFGDEAISTIVQEMENAREDTVVIFAGHPDKMEDLLLSNPGLKSRISFYVPFDDYGPEELLSILDLTVQKNGMTIDPGAYSKVDDIIRCTMHSENFGNGRFIRNLFEKAKMRQASRLVELVGTDVDDNYIRALVADDFEMPAEYRMNPKKRPIGF